MFNGGREHYMTNKKNTNEIREVSKISLKKADELEVLHKNIPKYIQNLTAYGRGLGYIADEIDRFENDTGKSIQVDYEDGISPKKFIATFKVANNTPETLSNMTNTLSGVMTASTGSTVGVISAEFIDKTYYLKDLPKYFKELNLDQELIQLLEEIKPSLADDWKAVRDNLTTRSSAGIKNAIVHARTVVDEIGWMTDFDYLKNLPWKIELDKEGKPIRAVRYAWIAYGDKLPNDLNGDPLKDTLYKSLNSGYKEFGKIAHVSPIPISQYPNALSACNAVGNALIQYLELGGERLENY